MKATASTQHPSRAPNGRLVRRLGAAHGILLASLALGACTTLAQAQAKAPTLTHSTAVGEVLTDPQGMTLYTFTKDSKGVSNCNGGCAAMWKPFTAAETAKASGDYSLIERSDGSYQWAYDGKPLYTWAGDKAPGDSNGQGFKNLWFVVPAEEESSYEAPAAGPSMNYGSGGGGY